MRTLTRRRRTTVVLLAVLLAAAMATGCGDAESGSGDAKTLKLWHYEAPDSAMGIAWAQAVKEFQDTHPGVTVQFEEKGFEQIQKTAPMVLNSAEVPDVLEYNKGNATAGLLAKQGLLTDLTAEAAARGWDRMLSPSLQTTARYDAKGVMGGGAFYGIPNYAEYVQVFYNKDMFAERGIAVPTSLAEFTAAMDTFVADGVTPLSVGGAEYPAQQIVYQLALSRADRAWVDAYQRYTGKVDFQDPIWTYAATTFAEWVNKGYIAKNATGVKAEDMGVAFTKGTFPMMVSGTWWHGRLQNEIKNFEWGAFLWPGNTMHAGSSGNLWVVPKNAKNKSLAYDFIDITMRKSAQNALAKAGGVPVAADPAALTDARTKELVTNFDTLVAKDGLAFYPDWPAPGYYDVLVSAVQKLINGSSTPAKVLDEIAGPYDENRANLGG